MWSRDSDRGDQFDLYQRNILEKYINFVSLMSNFKFKLAIFFIAVPHHLDGLLIDKVCRDLKIKQIFLKVLQAYYLIQKIILYLFYKIRFL